MPNEQPLLRSRRTKPSTPVDQVNRRNLINTNHYLNQPETAEEKFLEISKMAQNSVTLGTHVADRSSPELKVPLSPNTDRKLKQVNDQSLKPVPAPKEEKDPPKESWRKQLNTWQKQFKEIKTSRYSASIVKLLLNDVRDEQEDIMHIIKNNGHTLEDLSVKKIGTGKDAKKILVSDKNAAAGDPIAELTGHVMRVYGWVLRFSYFMDQIFLDF